MYGSLLLPPLCTNGNVTQHALDQSKGERCLLQRDPQNSRHRGFYCIQSHLPGSPYPARSEKRRSGDNSSVATALRKPYPIARIADVRLVHHQLIHDGTSRGFHRGLESVSWAFGSPSGSGPQDLHTESGTPKRNGGSIFEQTYRV